jgi:glycosyltransferase involved in cell wall biosynthesis
VKVLYATMQFGRGYGQGTERYLTILGTGLRDRGHEVVYLAGDPERRGPDLPLGAAVAGDSTVLAYPTYGNLAVVGLPPAELLPLLRALAPDLIHLANPAHIGIGLIEAARTLRIPIVVTVMDYWWLCPKHILYHYSGRICDANVSWRECAVCMCADQRRTWQRHIARLPLVRGALLPPKLLAGSLLRGYPPDEVRRWTRRKELIAAELNHVAAVIFPSRTGRTLLESSLTEPRCCSIPYGLEPRWFESGLPQDGPARRDDSSPRDPRKITIGYAGALAAHKGVHHLIEAVRGLGWTSTHVRIAGGGPDEGFIRNLRAAAAGLNVEFVGHVASEEIPGFLRQLDVAVVPSLWPENLPFSVLEAQAVGVPVLASRVGGIEETIPDPAHLFEPGSAQGLSRCLSEWCAATEPPTPAHVSTAGEMVAATLELYGQVIAATGAARIPHGAAGEPQVAPA